ncbi:MAG: hypothetical protein K6G61_08070 [Solobacterium sp.]|nr:hypothetical protein [Solobacterium sp.]
MDMEKDEIFTMIKDTLGIDLSEYMEEAEGVRKGARYYADLTAAEGKEEEIEAIITGLCGEGTKASSRKRPVMNNRLSENFEKAELLTVYDHMRQGTNGAKTVSTTIYTAAAAGKMHVFIFGG